MARAAALTCIILALLVSSSANCKTIEGRVEMIEQGEQPSLPRELLEAGLQENSFPDRLKGMWYGDVEVAQMETYPALHGDNAYSLRFIQEASNLFQVKKRGKVVLEIKRDRSGSIRVASSDVILRGGMKLQFTMGRGPALVPGGYNQPVTVTNRVVATSDFSAEQTRVDRVHIVDDLNMPIAGGFSEISATYTLTAPRRMELKILEIDYDHRGKPLWKILLKGTATR